MKLTFGVFLDDTATIVIVLCEQMFANFLRVEYVIIASSLETVQYRTDKMQRCVLLHLVRAM